MDYIDLHVHTTASDGTFTPPQLAEYAEQKGLYAVAITDHDTVAGIGSAVESAKSLKLKVIPGIELSADYSGREIHLLGYFIDYLNKDFLKALEPLKNSRDNRNILMLKKLEEIGVGISIENLNDRFKNSVITRAHIATYMIEKGVVKDKKEAFEKYIGKGGVCYVDRKRIPAGDAIKLVKMAGGLPVLAHPLLYHMDNKVLLKTIEDLKNQGLMGIEAIYSSHSKKEEWDLRAIAKRFHLYITGGSDFHGDIKPDIDLGTGHGNLKIPREILEGIISEEMIRMIL